jgi:hypothetical protein
MMMVRVGEHYVLLSNMKAKCCLGLIGVMTPRELFRFAGRMKNDPDKVDIEALVEETVAKVGLLRDCFKSAWLSSTYWLV